MPRKNRKNRKDDDTTRNGSSDFLADDFTIAESLFGGTLASDDNNNSSNNLEDVDNTDAYDLSQEEERYNKVVDALEHAFEITTEKRSSKREQYVSVETTLVRLCLFCFCKFSNGSSMFSPLVHAHDKIKCSYEDFLRLSLNTHHQNLRVIISFPK